MPYKKVFPIITLSTFLQRTASVTKFTSSTGRRYKVTKVFDNVIVFRRLDAKNLPWDIDLRQLYKAYVELDDYATENFRKYIPRRHSPGRGLLLHLKLIK
jgi:hypothetical protein